MLVGMRWLLVLWLLVAHAVAAELTLTFDPRWHGVSVAVPGATVHNACGQTLRLSRLSALISSISLVRADGTSVALPGQVGFIDIGSGRVSATLQDVPAGDYTGIAFTFGLPPSTNHSSPGNWPAGHPLNPLVNHLHWNWQGGYVFLAMEGHWSDPPDVADDEHGFSYHIAGDAHTMPVRFSAAFTVFPDTELRFAIELSRILEARRLDVADGSESTHSAANDTLVGDMTVAVRHSLFWLGADGRARAGGTPAATSGVAPGVSPTVSDVPPLNTAVAAHHARRLALEIPAGFPVPALPDDNPITAEGVELGRELFNDPRLSGSGTQSCADCHRANHAFSDTVARSRGTDGKPGVRNAMPLFNLAWSSSYAWDGSKPRIRDQAIAAMTNPIEMHGDPARVVSALQNDAALVEKFRAAFGTPEVTVERIGLALEQCLLTNVSADSKFDRALKGVGALTDEEKEGFALFMTEYDPARGRRGADCFHCHGGPLFTDYDFKNNGLDQRSSDPARAGVTGRPEDAGKFKTPSLRNVAVTAPYMHDGRFATLEDVIAHYDHGVQRSPTLDPNLAKHPNDGLKLTPAEQHALIAFLRTLTDSRWAKAD